MQAWLARHPWRQLRFLIVSRPPITGQVPGIAYDVIFTHLVKQADDSKKTAHTGAVTLRPWFGVALNLHRCRITRWLAPSS